MEKTLHELLNPEFTFKFAGKDYLVRKANLKQGILYQDKVQELLEHKTASVDLQLVGFCIWLILKEADPTITEDYVLNNTPADIDVVGTLTVLGFMNPKQGETARRLTENQNP